MNADERARRLFQKTYGGEPTLMVRAPGRVNLIGDHTDYNGGFVLPMAIDADLVIAARPREDRLVDAVSESQPGRAGSSLDSLSRDSGWGEYLKGVAAEMASESLVGWEGAIASDLADGAGLSSSAAIELATARVFACVSGIDWDPIAMAQIGQRAENDWVGMHSGVMDQMICATGRAGHARLIDCRSLEGTDIPLPPEATVVLLDTGTRRQLLDSAYNERRVACEEAARRLGVDQLRDATLEDLTRDSLPPELYPRARHVVTENLRTEAAAAALAAADAGTVGRLMNESHASLRDDFDVSSDALDAMARTAQAAGGCFGARQTGGGFAGSCLAIVETTAVMPFSEEVSERYETLTGNRCSVHVVTAANGVEARWIR